MAVTCRISALFVLKTIFASKKKKGKEKNNDLKKEMLTVCYLLCHYDFGKEF